MAWSDLCHFLCVGKIQHTWNQSGNSPIKGGNLCLPLGLSFFPSACWLAGFLFTNENHFADVNQSDEKYDCQAFLECVFEPFNTFPNKPWFFRVGSTSLLKTLWEKEKLLVTSNFSFSRSDFYPLGELSAIVIKFEIAIFYFFQFRSV